MCPYKSIMNIYVYIEYDNKSIMNIYLYIEYDNKSIMNIYMYIDVSIYKYYEYIHVNRV